MKQAMFAMILFWLDKGVDGFRLDVCNYYFKDALFSDNPFGLGPSPRLYDVQKHLYDRNQPETHAVLREFRTLLDSYSDRMAVGEVSVASPLENPELQSDFYGNGDDELPLVFDFSYMNKKWGAAFFFERMHRWDALVPRKAWPCHVLNNHDQSRSISRYGSGVDALKKAKVLAAMLITQRGTPFIYNGEEIGMPDGTIPYRRLRDPVGRHYWPLHPGRNPERTPM